MGDIRTTVTNAIPAQVFKRLQHRPNNPLHYVHRQRFCRQRLSEIFDGRSHNAEPETQVPPMVTGFAEMVVKVGKSSTSIVPRPLDSL